MLKRYLLVLFSVMGLTFGGAAVLSPAPVFAGTPQQEVCEGVGAATPGGGCSSGLTLGQIVRSILRIFAVVIGIFAVIMFTIAGFRFITANGDSNSITNARQSIIWGIVGLIVAAVSQAFVAFVLDNIT